MAINIRASWLAPILDAMVAVLAMFAASRLRFGAVSPVPSADVVVIDAFFVAAVLVAAGGVCGLYRDPHRLWPIRLMLSATVACGIAAAVVWMREGFAGVSPFVFMATAVLTVVGAGGWRAAEGLRAHQRGAGEPIGDAVFEDRAATTPPIGLGVLRLVKYRELLRNLVLKDLKLKYRGSTLGFVWSLANPLATLVVYSIAFTYILGVQRRAFVLFLFVGLLAWNFFASTIAMATTTIVDAGGLLKSVRFPRTVMPMATVMFNLSQYLLTFGVLLPVMMLAFRVRPAAPMLAYPFVLLLLVMFTSGVALIVATANVYFRDVKHLVDVGLQVTFWITPIVYDLNDVPSRIRTLILMSPMSPFVSALHDIFYRLQWPDAMVWMAAGSWSIAAFLVGLTIFLTYEDRLAEQL